MQTMHVQPGLWWGCFVVACDEAGRDSPSSWMARLASASSPSKASIESGSSLAAFIFASTESGIVFSSLHFLRSSCTITTKRKFVNSKNPDIMI